MSDWVSSAEGSKLRALCIHSCLEPDSVQPCGLIRASIVLGAHSSGLQCESWLIAFLLNLLLRSWYFAFIVWRDVSSLRSQGTTSSAAVWWCSFPWIAGPCQSKFTATSCGKISFLFRSTLSSKSGVHCTVKAGFLASMLVLKAPFWWLGFYLLLFNHLLIKYILQAPTHIISQNGRWSIFVLRCSLLVLQARHQPDGLISLHYQLIVATASRMNDTAATRRLRTNVKFRKWR